MATLPTSWKSGAKSKKTTFGSGASRPQVPSARDNLDQLMGALNTPRAASDANKPSNNDGNGAPAVEPDTKPPVQVTYGGVAGGYGSGDPVSTGVKPDGGPGQNDPPEPVDPKEEATAAGAFPAGGFTIGGRIPGTNKGVREFTITQDLFNLIPEAQRPAALAAFNGGTGSAMEYLSQNRMSPWGQQLSKAARFGRGGKDLVHKTPGNAWGNPTGWMQKRIDRNYEAQQQPPMQSGWNPYPVPEDGSTKRYGGPGWLPAQYDPSLWNGAPLLEDGNPQSYGQNPYGGPAQLQRQTEWTPGNFFTETSPDGKMLRTRQPDGSYTAWFPNDTIYAQSMNFGGPQPEAGGFVNGQWVAGNGMMAARLPPGYQQPTQTPYGTYFDPRILQGMYPGY